MEEILQLEAMNTSFYIAVTDCKYPDWKQPITAWIQYVEREWSRFQTNNELDHLNGLQIGEKMVLSPPMFDVLLKAEHYKEVTGRLFSPYLFPQMQFHGYKDPFPFQIAPPTNSLMPPVYDKEMAPFEFDAKTSTIKRITDGKVDLGGIGKGYAVQSSSKWLKEIGEARTGIVDGGGDLTVWSDGNKEWMIGVAHPFTKEKEIAQFRLKNGSVATSNTIYRSWLQGKQQKHHILNGKTGMPVESSIIQATAIATNCLDAEVAAKLCFMFNERDLVHQLRKLGNIHSLLLVDKAGSISHCSVS